MPDHLGDDMRKTKTEEKDEKEDEIKGKIWRLLLGSVLTLINPHRSRWGWYRAAEDLWTGTVPQEHQTDRRWYPKGHQASKWTHGN